MRLFPAKNERITIKLVNYFSKRFLRSSGVFILFLLLASPVFSATSSTTRIHTYKYRITQNSPSVTISGPSTSNGEVLAQNDYEHGAYADPFERERSNYRIPDPIEPVNRGIFWFNDKLYIYVARPTTRGYRFLLGQGVRKRVGNVFDNLDEPRNFVNSFFQARPTDASISFSRFLINSTVGVAGIFNPAGYWMDETKRNLNQTFGKWGIHPGFYIVWPFFGSSSLRGTVGEVGDGFLYPPYYLEGDDAGLARTGLTVLRNVNSLSFQLGRYEDLKRASIDPYIGFKNFYEQRVEQKLKQ